MEETHLLGCVPSILDGTEHEYKSDKTLDIPESYDYRPFLTPVVLQKGNTCVCNSTISALDWQLNMRDGTYDFNGFDPNEIYGSRQDKSSDCGMQLKESLDYCHRHGIKYNKGVFKIGNYAMIGSLDVLKYALVENGVCLCGVPVYNMDKLNFWKKEGEMKGGHALAIVGYDDINKSLIIRNSWGKNWGDNGYVMFPYNDFGEIWEIWTIL